MDLRQILHEDLGCASYFLAADGVAAVIDPKWEIADYLRAADETGSRIAHVIETHTHADHVSGRIALAEATGAAIHLPSEGGGDGLRGGDVLELGRVRVEVLGTPGHRPEHVSLIVSGGGRTVLLSGDSLLVGDVARPDLAVPGAEGAQAMWTTLRRLERLGDTVELWPAHVGGSLCASGALTTEARSTIGRERERNRGLLAPDYRHFADELLATLPARPPCVGDVVALNREGARPPAPLPVLTAAELAGALLDGACVLDVRAPDEFDAAHLAGALNLPAVGTGIGTRAGWVAAREREIVIVAETEEVAGYVSSRLYAAGIWSLAGIAVANIGAWNAAGLDLFRASALLPAALVEGLQAARLRLVDVRDRREWDSGHVDGSIHLPLDQLLDGRDTSLPPGPPVVVACARGPRAALAASVLRRAGERRVTRLVGGIGDLPALGLPLLR